MSDVISWLIAPLELVDVGVLPADLVRQLDVALHEGATGALDGALDQCAEAQDVVLHIRAAPARRSVAGARGRGRHDIHRVRSALHAAPPTRTGR